MKYLCCVLLVLLPLSAFAYPIELEQHVSGVEVTATTQDIGHDLGALLLHNAGSVSADCRAIFRNGPETPQVRQVRLAPDQRGNLTVKFGRTVVRLRIELVCEPG